MDFTVHFLCLEQQKNVTLYLVSTSPSFTKTIIQFLRKVQCIMKVTVHQKRKKVENGTRMKALQSLKVNFDNKISSVIETPS